MKLKTLLLTLIIATGALNADEPVQFSERIATLLTYLVNYPAVAQKRERNIQEVTLLLAQKRNTQITSGRLIKIKKELTSADHAKAQLKEVALQVDKVNLENTGDLMRRFSVMSPSSFYIRMLAEAANRAETIHDSYSYFNPYRYILGNKISYLYDLQGKASGMATDITYQEEVKNTLNSLISWLG